MAAQQTNNRRQNHKKGGLCDEEYNKKFKDSVNGFGALPGVD
jgi:hypothetical protein